MQIKIKKIIYPGKSLGESEGKIIMTDEGVPGETVEIKIIREKKNYSEAKTIAVIEPSPLRVKPQCGHYQVCSPYQYIDYNQQIEIKQAQLKEIFQYIYAADIKCLPCPNIFGYRNKIRLNVIKDADLARFAYNVVDSHDKFIGIDECGLVSQRVNLLLKALIDLINKKQLYFIKEIEIRENLNTETLLLFYADDDKNLKGLGDVFKDMILAFNIKGISCFVADKKGFLGYIVYGDNFIEETVGGKKFLIGAGSFFQVNIHMLEIVIEYLRSSLNLSKKDRLADLYCGIGTFGISFADSVKEAIGADALNANTDFLRKNIELNGINNFKVYEGSCERLAPVILDQGIGILILDPPRKGLEQSICKAIIEKPVKQIAYLSCNPTTLCRDIKILSSAYEIKNITAFDFFPQTPHIETLALLTRAG